jgi:hypothetical protein
MAMLMEFPTPQFRFARERFVATTDTSNHGGEFWTLYIRKFGLPNMGCNCRPDGNSRFFGEGQPIDFSR